MKHLPHEWYAGAMVLTLALSGLASNHPGRLTADITQTAGGIRFASPTVIALTAKDLTQQCRTVCAQQAIGDGGWYKYGLDGNGDLVRVHAEEGEAGAARGTACDFIPYGIWDSTYQSGQQCLCGVRQGRIDLEANPIPGVARVLGPETVADEELDHFIHSRTAEICAAAPGYFGVCIYADADHVQDGNECQGFCLSENPKICNPNQVCEPLNGENPVNCPADCWSEGGSIPSPYCLADEGQPGTRFGMEEFLTPWSSPAQPAPAQQGPIPISTSTQPNIQPIATPPSMPTEIESMIAKKPDPELAIPMKEDTNSVPKTIGSSYVFTPFDTPVTTTDPDPVREPLPMPIPSPIKHEPTAEPLPPALPVPVEPAAPAVPTKSDLDLTTIPIASQPHEPIVPPALQIPLLQNPTSSPLDLSAYWQMMRSPSAEGR